MSTRKRSGAKPARSNASKRERQSRSEPPAVPDPSFDFASEIECLRVHARKLLTALENTQDPDQLLALHRTIGHCTLNLLRFQRMHLNANPGNAAQSELAFEMSRRMRELAILYEAAQPQTGVPGNPSAS